MRYVVDSSVMIKAFVREPDSEKARELVYSTINEDNRLIAPDLIVYEVNHGFIRKIFSSARRQTAHRKIDEFMRLVEEDVLVLIAPDSKLLQASHKIAQTVTPPGRRPWSYDAVFHALAMRENIDLVTADYAYINRFDQLAAQETSPEVVARLTALRRRLVRLDKITLN